MRCADGDDAAFDSLEPAVIVSNAAVLAPRLKSMASRLEDPPALNRGFKGILSLVASEHVVLSPLFGELFSFLLSNVERSCNSHDWKDPRKVQTAHFCVAHTLAVAKQHPLRAFSLGGNGILDVYYSTSLHGVHLADNDASRKLFNTVSARLELAASVLFKEMSDEQRLGWLGALFGRVSSPVDAVAAFGFMCGVMREIPSTDCGCALDMVVGMLLWLPGMSSVLYPATDLQRNVTSACVHLPPDFFCAAAVVEEGSADAPPFQKWWLSTLRVATNLSSSDELVAVMVASLCCSDPLTVERAASLWSSLLHFSGADDATMIRKHLSDALDEISDHNLRLRLGSVFSLPVPAVATDSVLLALSRVIGSPLSSNAAVVLAGALIAGDRTEFVTTLLRDESTRSDPSRNMPLLSILCSPAVLNKHPALRFHILSTLKDFLSVAQVQLDDTSLEKTAAALEVFLEVQADGARDTICPIVTDTGAAGKRDRDEDGMSSMVARLADMVRGGSLTEEYRRRVADLLSSASH